MYSLDQLEALVSPETLAGLADDDADGIPDAAVLTALWDISERTVRQAVAGVLTLADGDALPAVLADIAHICTIDALYARRREIPPQAWAERAALARAQLAAIAGDGQRLPGQATPPAVRCTHEPESRVHRAETLEPF